MNKNKISIIIGFIIILVILFEIIFYANEGIKLSKLNNLYKDIEILEDKTSLYYLNNTELPVKPEKIEFEHSINPNDNEIYYEIDLEKFYDLNLSYGKKTSQDDIYIINEQSHTIYYYLGIEYNDNMYYTKKIDYQKVELENY